jgi:hypothetical protein
MAPPQSAIVAAPASNVLLFIALLTPPMSHKALAATFLPLIFLFNTHAWAGGLGFISIIHSFWAADLLVFRDPRRDFKLIHYPKHRRDETQSATTIVLPLVKQSYPQ